MKNEPVAIIELVKIVVNLAIVWSVVMGFWQLSDMQQAATISFALAVVNLGGAVWQRASVYSPATVARLMDRTQAE